MRRAEASKRKPGNRALFRVNAYTAAGQQTLGRLTRTSPRVAGAGARQMGQANERGEHYAQVGQDGDRSPEAPADAGAWRLNINNWG